MTPSAPNAQSRRVDVLRTIGCDDFEMGLLPVLRHQVRSVVEAQPQAFAHAFDIAVGRWGEAIGLPTALAMYKVAFAAVTSRALALETQDPLCPEARGLISDDEVQLVSMIHHMRRDNTSAARSAVAFVTRGRMDPELIRAGLGFAQRFPAAVRQQGRVSRRPTLSVVA